MEQPAVFNAHCGTEFVTPINPGIYPVMPEPAPTAAILYELVRIHKQEVSLFNEYHTVAVQESHKQVDPGALIPW